MTSQTNAPTLAVKSLFGNFQAFRLSTAGWLAVFVLLPALVLAMPPLTQAQETPRVQVFAGYSHLQFDSTKFGFSGKTGLNGGTLSGGYNLTPEFGVVAEVAGEFGTNFRVRDFMVGPQLMYSKWHSNIFGHVLFGKADTRVETTTVREVESNMAVAFGGGVDFPISSRFSIRLIQADYFRMKAFGADQNNLRLATGLVYRWGTITKRRKKL